MPVEQGEDGATCRAEADGRRRTAEDGAGSGAERPPGTAVLTRRRVDTSLAMVFVLALLAGVLRAWLTGRWQFLLTPIAVIPLWVVIRGRIPREGLGGSPIRSTPGAVVLLGFMAAALVAMGAVVAVDASVWGRSGHGPWEPSRAAPFLLPFLIMVTGAFWADRIARARRRASLRDDHEQAS